MIHPDAKRRHEDLRKLEVIASACRHLGTRIVTLCTGTRDSQNMWRHHPENNSLDAWKDLLGSLDKALSTAEEHDVTLAFEPEMGNVINSARKARRLLDEISSPRLKVIMDPANLLGPGDLPRMKEVFTEAFDLLGSDIVLAHAKEIAPNGSLGDLSIGSGVLEWDWYLALLRQVNFAGPLILHGFDETAVEASVSFLRKKVVSS
jgi:sugar phosphate isomerase/epimerase